MLLSRLDDFWFWALGIDISSPLALAFYLVLVYIIISPFIQSNCTRISVRTKNWIEKRKILLKQNDTLWKITESIWYRDQRLGINTVWRQTGYINFESLVERRINLTDVIKSIICSSNPSNVSREGANDSDQTIVASFDESFCAISHVIAVRHCNPPGLEKWSR